MEVYAAYSKNENLLMKSSSGALFGVIAKLFLKMEILFSVLHLMIILI